LIQWEHDADIAVHEKDIKKAEEVLKNRSLQVSDVVGLDRSTSLRWSLDVPCTKPTKVEDTGIPNITHSSDYQPGKVDTAMGQGCPYVY
jgi:hypothetical protein